LLGVSYEAFTKETNNKKVYESPAVWNVYVFDDQ